jgi:nitrate reductase gamma subunit
MIVTFLGSVLPIFAILIFVVGMAYRLNVWRKLPAPKMTLFPAPNTTGARFNELLKETFFFKSLFKADKSLWFMGWIFHAMLTLVFIGHFRVVSWLPDRILQALGLNEASIDTMSAAVGGAAGLVILAMAVVILLRRLLVPRTREISGAGDYFAMLLIIAILITGDAMRFLSHFDLVEAREYFQGLFTLSAAKLPANPWFQVHFLLGQILIMYIPFSKILHFGGIFFTESLVRKH